jgi:sodium-dependent dicarboxylate transporter 2/3/5
MLLASVAGIGASLLAPDPWPSGEGRVEIAYRNALVVSAPVEVGATDPVRLAAPIAGGRLTVSFPGGVPIDAPVEATIRLTREGAPAKPALHDVRVEVVLPDGAAEPIPVLRWDGAAGELVATRRPPVRSAAVLGLLGVVVVMWVSGALPTFVTALIVPVVLVGAGAASAEQALAPFFDPVIALFFGGFLMAEAMRRVRLDHLAAVTIVARAGRSPVVLFAVSIGVSAFLSMWMSNTAAAAVLLPIAIAVTAPVGDEAYRKATVLGVAYAATIGGVGSAIGTPANPLAITFLRDFVGHEVSFAAWFGFGLPMLVLFLPVMGTYLWYRGRTRVDRERFVEARRVAAEQLAEVGRPTRDQWIVLAVFAAIVGVWLTQTWHGLDTGIVAVAGAAVLGVLRKVLPEDLANISWESLVTFGGGLTLGLFLSESGTSDWLATRVGGLREVPVFVAVAVVAAVTLAVTAVASNTASAAMLIPLAIPLAGVLGVDPVMLVVVVAIASSIDFALIIGTPPTMLAYSTRLYTPGEIFRTGIALDAVGLLLLLTVVVAVWELLGLI